MWSQWIFWKKCRIMYYNKNGKIVAVVGSRSLTDESLVYDFLNKKKDKIKLLCSGGAKRGADFIAHKWAKEVGFPILIFYPQWYNEDGEFVKSAGYARNYEIVAASDIIIAFLQAGGSKGTQHTIDIAKDLGKPCQVIEFNPVETL